MGAEEVPLAATQAKLYRQAVCVEIMRATGLRLPFGREFVRPVSRFSVASQLSPVVFPHSDKVSLEGSEISCSKLVEMLQASVTPDRLQKMQQVSH